MCLPVLRRLCLAVFLCALVAGPTGSDCALKAQDAPNRRQLKQLQRIESLIERGGGYYQQKQYEASAKAVQEAQKLLESVSRGAAAPLLQQAAPLHEQLRQAHRLLTGAGQTLPPLRPLPAPPATAAPSFVGQVAPLLVARCGQCHVRNRRGDFSMASYARLMQAGVIEPGKPDESRLLELVRSGEMPRAGQPLSAQNKALLQRWIELGAPFDGPDPMGNLARFRSAPPGTPQPIEQATGGETIRFALDVAPVLIDRCGGCHFEPTNARGGLTMTTFRDLWRGGDSGPVITPGDGTGSLLVGRLRGAGGLARMPPEGRKPIADETIARISRWIDEGARFDGQSPTLNLRTVVDVARALAATHEELSRDRQTRSMALWRTVMSDTPAATSESRDMLLIGRENLGKKGSGQLQEVRDALQPLLRGIGKELKLEHGTPVVKGRLTVFVFDRRYDYGEFGRMVEQRELPRKWTSHWGYDTVNAYVAILMDGSLEDRTAELAQRVGAIVARQQSPDMPDWFANGWGYCLAEPLVGNKKTVQQWREQAAAAAASMRRPTDFLRGAMPEDQAGQVAYAFVKPLIANRSAWKRFLDGLKQGAPFEEAFGNSFQQSPAQRVQQVLGSGRPQPPGRRR